MSLSPDVETILNTGARLAHLVTINPDGSPHVTIVWTGVADGAIVTAHLSRWKKLKNLERDPRVTLSVETGSVNDHGLAEYLVVDGTATVHEGGAPELLQQLAHRYIGADAKFPPMDNPPPGFTLRITPTKVGGIGPWKS
jgi:PPOX class probable F420-dependent enzyme